MFRRAFSVLSALSYALVITAPAVAQQPVTHANYKLATKFSTSFLRQFTYDSVVSPNWIGETETFWYRFRTSEGRRYWLVDATTVTKVALFDHDQFAAQLSEACETPIDAYAIDITAVKFGEKDKSDEMTFVCNGFNFVFNRTTGKLEKKDKAKANSTDSERSRRGRGGFGRRDDSSVEKKEKTEKEKKAEAEAREQARLSSWRRALEADAKKKAGTEKEEDEEDEEQSNSRREPTQIGRHRSAFSPDLSWYVFARQNNLHLTSRTGKLQDITKVMTAEEEAKAKEKTKAAAAKKATGKAKDGAAEKVDAKTADAKQADAKKGDAKKGDAKQGDAKQGDAKKGDAKQADAKKADAKQAANGTHKTTGEKKPDGKATAEGDGAKNDDPKKESLVFPFTEKSSKQLTEDGAEDYSYGGRKEDEFWVPASVTWSPDSAAFFVTRGDSRGVAELFLVDSLGDPRPKLHQYKYPMPGEDKVRHSEFMMFHKDTNELTRLIPKWKDEQYVDSRWMPDGELRVLRRDRTLRKVEYGIVDPKLGTFETLFAEQVEKGNLNTQSIRYLDERDEFIWWSERTGWGHYYLYGLDGKLKNAITSGRFRASSVVEVDEEKGLLWFRANGRERGENIYYEHLYRVRLDGGDLTLLDQGDATHRSSLSKSGKFVVDNLNRVDMSPQSVLRDGEGELVMELEKSDTSQLEALGWQAPERFTVKAADGVTDLYGNMWKPFDFDPSKRYPIIAHVYPGPQTEGVTHTFSASGSRQELAQLGFIVIQVGHRGGTPTRSKAYGNYGYYNMRDYALEDKKCAIEQLAALHDFIDIDRVGIYGHSGGGFFTAAALLRPPYNDFFKVGVSTSGNHDNNIYNNSWGERYHGLKEKAEAKKGAGKGREQGQKNDEKEKTEKTEETEKTKTEETKTEKTETGKTVTQEQQEVEDQEKSLDDVEKKTKYDIKIATNAELAANLKGKLLLVHGEMDNNVHPAGTMRLVNALIKANKRFDLLIIPGARHGYGAAGDYVKHRTWEYFAEHLLGDRQLGADIGEKR